MTATTITLTATEYAQYQSWKAARIECDDAYMAREKAESAHRAATTPRTEGGSPETFAAVKAASVRYETAMATLKAFGTPQFGKIYRQEHGGATVVAE